MIRALWLKKIWKGRSKGVSSVIGTVFLILIVFAISTNVFLWTISQSAIYNQAVKESNQKNAEKLNENIVAANANYSVPLPNKVKVDAKLTNAGSVSAQVINLWVFDTTIQRYGFNDTIASLNLNLNPGNVSYLTDSNGIMVTIEGASSADNFVAWFVTARGNTVALQAAQSIIVANLAQGIGSIALDFYAFRYYTYSGSKLANYPAGILGFNVPYNVYIAFGVTLTNLDPSKKTITLDVHSQLWLYFPTVPGAGPFAWYIANVATDGSIITPYTPITLAYTETKLLVFVSSVESGSTKVKIDHPQVDDKLCAVNLLLHGTIGTRDYGQNIPFVSLYVS